MSAGGAGRDLRLLLTQHADLAFFALVLIFSNDGKKIPDMETLCGTVGGIGRVLRCCQGLAATAEVDVSAGDTENIPHMKTVVQAVRCIGLTFLHNFDFACPAMIYIPCRFFLFFLFCGKDRQSATDDQKCKKQFFHTQFLLLTAFSFS